MGDSMGESRSDLGNTDDEQAGLLARGTAVDRYVMLERLGAGAMGVVYAAYDPDLDRKVAIKLLRTQRTGGDDSRRRARLQREAQAIAKLSHGNVVSIFDVGVHEGQVFLAMEHLSGGTLQQWLKAKKRPLREILDAFVEIGRGLSAAHAEGLVHRDFKPDNVLFDRQGKPKIVDFGLVRLSAALDESTSSGPGVRPGEVAPAVAALAADNLTRTGAMTGTPAYMAPEQFLGQPVSAQSDQFAYCVALYEALYGARPFQGDTVYTLAETVLAHKIAPPPPGAAVPPWIRRILERGLATKPGARFETMAELVRQLDRRPLTLKKVATVGGIGVAATVVLVVVTSIVGGRARARAEIEATTKRTMDEAARFEQEATSADEQGARLRADAFRLFDEGSGLGPAGAQEKSWAHAEDKWSEVMELESAAETAYGRATAALDTAFFIDPRRADVRDRLAQVMARRLRLAARTYQREREAEFEQRLLGLQRTGTAVPASMARLAIRLPSDPNAHITTSVARYTADRSGRLLLGSPETWRGDEPRELAPGSYVVVATAAGGASVRLPVLLDRDRLEVVTVPPVAQWTAPQGMVFVSEGDALIGTDEENVRTALDVPPLHRVHLGAFVIGRYEVTFAEYIAWLGSLAPLERARRTPRSTSSKGAVALRPATNGTWTLFLQPTSHAYLLPTGQPIRYPGRKAGAVQDWRRFPVTGISLEDARAYTRWLAQSAHLRDAHVCTEIEWERAARGADGRIFTTGRRLLPAEANFDLTYGGTDLAFGPDEVGSHPESASPFGVEDLHGNAEEMVATSRWNEAGADRGGSWFRDRVQQRLDNRFRLVPSARDAQTGFRLCASPVQP